MAPATRATTSRIAKSKAQARMKRLVGNEEEEITFPRLSGFETVDSEYDSTNPPHLSPAHTLAEYNEGRVDRLENDVTEVKNQVADINDKLDILVNAACVNPRPLHHSTPPRREIRPPKGPERLPQGWRDESLPPPRQLRREANYDGYVDTVCRADRFNPPRAQGKALTYDQSDSMRKPYMYIVREECQTEKQKLDVRCNLTSLEYINALVKLLMDPRAYPTEDQPHILRHLRDVSQDAMERPWVGVRKWSQSVFDDIAGGEFAWSDYQLIQNARVRFAMTAPSQSQAQAKHVGQAKEYLCREFNSRGGCRQRGDHHDGNVKVLHLCAFCDAVQRQCTHSVVACERKLSCAPRVPRQGQPFHQQPQQQWRQPAEYYPLTTQQQPKNGLQAPRQY